MTGGGTVPITPIPAGGVSAGNLVVVSIATAGDANISGGAVAVTDSRGNTYTADLQTAAWGTNRRTFIRSSRIATALQAGDTITVTVTGMPGFGIAAAGSATEFTGIAASPLDRTASGLSAMPSTSVSTNSTATTAQANELLIGAIGDTDNTTFTQGASYTALPGAVSCCVAVWPEFRIVAATGMYTATGTLGSAYDWGALIATYKGDTCATDVTGPAVTPPASATLTQTTCN